MCGGIYYAITLVLTTAATVLGVIVLRIHHQVSAATNNNSKLQYKIGK